MSRTFIVLKLPETTVFVNVDARKGNRGISAPTKRMAAFSPQNGKITFMSGHSRWAGIKHKKAITDSKKGKVFTKLAREISVAAKAGGGNPDHNARLRKAIEDAREANMPQDNVKKAIQKGTGEIPGVAYEEIRYEGYGPGGVALLVDVTTDNRNRTSSEIRKIFSSHGLAPYSRN